MVLALIRASSYHYITTHDMIAELQGKINGKTQSQKQVGSQTCYWPCMCNMVTHSFILICFSGCDWSLTRTIFISPEGNITSVFLFIPLLLSISKLRTKLTICMQVLGAHTPRTSKPQHGKICICCLKVSSGFQNYITKLGISFLLHCKCSGRLY